MRITPFVALFVLFFCVGLIIPFTAQAQTSTTPETSTERTPPASATLVKLSFAPVVQKAAPAVVNIYTRKLVEQRQQLPGVFSDPLFQRFFGDRFGMGAPRQKIENSLGSGVIVRPDGVVVTNHHVIEGAEEITVILQDKREFEAKLVGSDERTDIAVLKMQSPPKSLPYLEPKDSESLLVGDLVVAVGNPFGVGQTVTMGIVSALARTTVGVTDFRSFIQTDAAINPGNSGGALVDISGQLVGINTAIYSRSGGSNGIGFAIPSELVRTTVAGILQYGRAVRAWLGAEGQAVDADIAISLGMTRPTGVLVSHVSPDSPAAKAGLRVGDVVLAVNRREVSDEQALRYRIATLPVGGKAVLTIGRNGKIEETSVELLAPPEKPPRNTTRLQGRHPFEGAVIANLSPALAEEVGMAQTSGVVIMEIARRSIADRLGLQPGDIIVSINGRKIKLVKDATAILGRESEGWQAEIDRQGHILSLNLGR